MSDWKPRHSFDGYTLVRLLGRGGMGEVHLARDTVLDRSVAIKFILAAKADEHGRVRFLQEARAIARLQHPNVVSVYRAGEVDGMPYLVSEFVRGHALDTLVLPVPGEKAKKIAVDIARALAAAHRQGVIHRDIKPANAIYADDGQVKLLDFGIAKLLPTGFDLDTYRDAASRNREPVEQTSVVPPEAGIDSTLPAFGVALLSGPPVNDQATAQLWGQAAQVLEESLFGSSTAGLTRSGAALGTPRYMAPEIWRGEPATFRSDIYSFGALIYHLCAGEPPFTGRGVGALCAAVLNDDFIPLAGRAPDIEPAFAEIIDRCIARDQAERYPTGSELCTALERLESASRARSLPEGNPYRGLHTFEAEHKDIFFGRDAEIRDILDQLTTQSFVLVAGDSGVGKSSLCRAGVLTRIEERLDPKRRWRTVSFIPGPHPVTSLSACLSPVLGITEERLQQMVLEDPAGAGREIRARQGEDTGLVIFIDQTEELVTVGRPEEKRAVSELLGWLSIPAPGVRLLATARGDFLSRLAELPGIGDGISRALFFLRPLSEDRVREAIVGPAEAKGVSFESAALIDELAASTLEANGALPLLQFALAELWDAKPPGSKTITKDSLDRLGGVSGALARHADDVMGKLSFEHKAAARRVLLQLVTAEGTRARKTGEEIDIEKKAVRKAVDELVRGRLLVARDVSGGASYEIAHETLTTGWPTLARWMSEDAGARLIHERLRHAVKEWERLGNLPELLWGPRQIAEAEAIDRDTLTDKEKRFLSRSSRAALRRKLGRAAVPVAVLLVGAIIYAVLAVQAQMTLDQKVAGHVERARHDLEKARAMNEGAHRLRDEALFLFDKPKVEDAEGKWAEFLKLENKLAPLYGSAARQLETALLLDRQRDDVGSMFADVLYERALLAEERHSKAELAELLERLALYDQGGTRRAKWNAAGKIAIATKPLSRVEIFEYRRDDKGRSLPHTLVEVEAPVRDHELPPGSYLAVARLEGHAEVRYPFAIRRGEAREIFLDLPRVEDIPPGHVYVPAGSFLFGSAAEDGQRRDFFHAPPLHEVSTDSYLISIHETTFADWIAFLEALPEHQRDEMTPRIERGGFQGALELTRDAEGVWTLSFQPTTQRYTAIQTQKVVFPARETNKEQTWERFPVFGITVHQARAYAAWLDRTGLVPGARLCTGHEWERAARGSDGREFPHGDAMRPGDANYDDTYGKEPGGIGPDEVGSRPASMSPFGVHDMAGNVWEWTTSVLDDGEIAARGGSYLFGLNSSRVTDREITEPSFRDVSVGLRICAAFPPIP